MPPSNPASRSYASSFITKRHIYGFAALTLLATIVLTPKVSHAASAVQVSPGSYLTCVLTAAGAAKCSGVATSSPPDTSGLLVDVPGTSGIASLSTGEGASCAVTTGGGVKCWGSNYHGELGDGTTTTSYAPVDVVGLSSGVASVSAGGGSIEDFACALTSTGGVSCWGANNFGQLGNGTTVESHTPTAVIGLSSGVVEVGAGGNHACALTGNGAVKCWGANYTHNLGDGTTTNSSTPVSVLGLASGVETIAVGGLISCALTTSGQVKCWGFEFPTLTEITGFAAPVASIAAGSGGACALLSTGAVQCWGDNSSGELGDGSPAPYFPSTQSVPVAVGLSGPARSLTGGGSAALGTICAVLESGGIECWGSGAFGQAGDGFVALAPTPQDVVGLGPGAQAVTLPTASLSSPCALTASGGVKCWGSNHQGELGAPTASKGTATPVDVIAGGSSITGISEGSGDHACALTAAGGVKCWGQNGVGQLGNGSAGSPSSPVDVSGLGGGTATVATGGQSTCAVTASGGVKCWGYNFGGMLGDGTTANSAVPVDVAGISSGATAVSLSAVHTCAVVAGGVKCWGSNSSGQLGNGTTTSSAIPVDVSGLASGVSRLCAGASGLNAFSCALTTAGAVKCWGANGSGQLGNGTTGNSSAPVDVSGLGGGVAAIACGGSNACAITSGGALKCWGFNNAGIVSGAAESSASSYTTPVDVPAFPSGVLRVGLSYVEACVVTTSGDVKCWGYSDEGGLGNGVDPWRSTPVTMLNLDHNCTTLDAPRLKVTKQATPPGDDAFTLSGQMFLSYPFNPPLDPVTDGLRIGLFRTTGHGSVLDETLIPNGAYSALTGKGWKTNGTGTTFSYANHPNDLPGHITSAKISVSTKTPGLVNITVKGKAGSFSASAGDLPIEALVSLRPQAASGQCGIQRFEGPPGSAPSCELNGSASTLICK